MDEINLVHNLSFTGTKKPKAVKQPTNNNLKKETDWGSYKVTTKTN